MEVKISDMMDTILDDTVQFQIKNIASSDRIREATMKKLHDNADAHRCPGKVTTILIAAVITVSLLTGAAFATGTAQSVFSTMIGWYRGDDATKYEVIDELSNKEEVSVTIPQMEDSLLTLSQSYYDGKQLMLGYTLNAHVKPAKFDFGPEHENLDKLVPVETETTVVNLSLEDKLTADEYAQFMQTLEETGSAGVIFYDIYVSDHVLLEDGEDIGPYDYTELPNGVYMEFITPLAEAAQNQAELSIFFKVKCTPWYYYQNSEGAYYYCAADESEIVLIEFTIPRSVG